MTRQKTITKIDDKEKVVDKKSGHHRAEDKDRQQALLDIINYYQQFKDSIVNQLRQWLRISEVQYPPISEHIDDAPIFDVFQLYWAFTNSEYEYLTNKLTALSESPLKRAQVDNDINALDLTRNLYKIERAQLKKQIAALETQLKEEKASHRSDVQALEERLFCETDGYKEEIVQLELQIERYQKELKVQEDKFECVKSDSTESLTPKEDKIAKSQKRRLKYYECMLSVAQEENNSLEAENQYLKTLLDEKRALHEDQLQIVRTLRQLNRDLKKRVDELEWIYQTEPQGASRSPIKQYFFRPATEISYRDETEEPTFQRPPVGDRFF